MSIGSLALALALPTAIYSIVASILGGPRSRGRARAAGHLVTLLLSIATCMLAAAFAGDDFGVAYVSQYSSRSLPLLYKLSGVWAGLDGSLLFWAFLLAACSSIAVVRERRVPGASPARGAAVGAVLQGVVAFFLLMLVFQANPFAPLSHPAADGRGLNPLLQNAFMIVHPPVLYLGYVGFSIPFAYAAAALLLRQRMDEWLGEIRLWTLFSWLCLTLGNLLGAMWAYVELGWGGFWAWDPVENAGIMPWFTACALLHTLVLQERRGMLRMWNIALAIFTFLLTIFGTFITRSGIIRSVHSFSDITIGLYFVVFMLLVVAASAVLIPMRRRELAGRGRLEHLLSREGSFYLNNALLLFALSALIWGTMLPLLSQLATGRQGEVWPAFFNTTMAPIGIALLILIGAGPEMSWRRLRRGALRREFLFPAALAVATAVMAFALGVRKWFPLAALASAAFVLAEVADEFVRASRASVRRLGGRRIAACCSLFRRAPRRFGGYAVHAGLALLFIGIAGSAYQAEHRFALAPGESKAFGGYELSLISVDWVQGEESEGVIARVSLGKGGKPMGELAPALFLHRNQPKPIAEVDLRMEPLRDIYLALGSVSGDGQRAEFILTVNPLIIFVWLGGAVMVIGSALALIPRGGRAIAPTEAEEENALDIALDRADQEDFA